MTPFLPRPDAMRLSALLVFIGLPALCLALGLVNLLQLVADGDRARDIMLQVAALEHRIDRVVSGPPVAQENLLIEATSRTGALAGLQQALLDATADAGGRIVEAAAMDSAATDDEDTARISVRTTLDIDNDGLLKLLHRLESGLPLMEIASLTIRRVAGPEDMTDTIVLRVEMTAGARWKQAGKAAP